MDPNALFKGFKSGAIGLKRAAERASFEVMGSVGLSNSPDNNPQYDSTFSVYTAQTDAIRSLRSDAVAAFDAMARATSTAYALASRLNGALSGPDGDARLAVDALMAAQRTVADEVLSRVERRVKKRVIAPADEELEKAKEITARVQGRKKGLIDVQRYRQRESEEDRRKVREKTADLEVVTVELIAMMNAAMPRRFAFIERAVAETIEFQRRFYLDSARLMERAVDAVGQDRLASLRGTSEDPDTSRSNLVQDFDDDLVQHPRPQRRPSQSSIPLPHQQHSQSHSQTQSHPSSNPRTSNGLSLWDEDDDDDDPHFEKPSHRMHENPFENDFEDVPTPKPLDTSPLHQREDSAYPSTGVGKRESSGVYPTSGVGFRETLSSYPTGGSRQRESVYPTAKPPTRGRPPTAVPVTSTSRTASSSSAKPSRRSRNDGEADLLNFDDTDTVRSSSRSKKTSPAPAVHSTEDLLDLGISSSKRPMPRSASTIAMEGDLLGDFGSVPTAPTKSRSTNPPRPRGPSPSISTSSSAPSMRTGSPNLAATGGGNLERERLKKMHEAEIKARADEKLAAVREREKADEKERDQKDNARGSAEARVNQWMGNGARRGNLRALLASLDTVLYPGATWQPVAMATLKANPKVKVNYHKAILQVHPDKIGSKNLPPDQQVLAELIFDELKNAYEVWTAEQDGRPPPPGSVGPKGAPNAGANAASGFGNMSRPGMYNNMGRGGMPMGGMSMGGMGRGGMGAMPMGGMGRGGMPMGGRGGMPMGSRGGMPGRGYGGMGGMGGMGSYGGVGRRGTGMGNVPPSFNNSRNGQQRR